MPLFIPPVDIPPPSALEPAPYEEVRAVAEVDPVAAAVASGDTLVLGPDELEALRRAVGRAPEAPRPEARGTPILGRVVAADEAREIELGDRPIRVVLDAEFEPLEAVLEIPAATLPASLREPGSIETISIGAPWAGSIGKNAEVRFERVGEGEDARLRLSSPVLNPAAWTRLTPVFELERADGGRTLLGVRSDRAERDGTALDQKNARRSLEAIDTQLEWMDRQGVADPERRADLEAQRERYLARLAPGAAQIDEKAITPRSVLP